MVWGPGLGFSWLYPSALDHSLSFPICKALLGPEATPERILIPPLKAGSELVTSPQERQPCALWLAHVGQFISP